VVLLFPPFEYFSAITKAAPLWLLFKDKTQDAISAEQARALARGIRATQKK
jgi:hypothetical protein